VELKHYRSIDACSVELSPLTFIVGPNGSGKSNFLDALALVSDALNTNLDNALRDRGGIGEVRRKSHGHPTHVGVRLEFELPTGARGYYTFEIHATRDDPYEIGREDCVIYDATSFLETGNYTVKRGDISQTNLSNPPPAAADRLYLSNAAGYEPFRELYDALAGMSFHNFTPDEMRKWQGAQAGSRLTRNGSNIADVLRTLERQKSSDKDLIEAYVREVVPGISGVETDTAGNRQTLLFKQHVEGSKHPWKFHGESISDGTLRALGVLTAIFQSSPNGSRQTSLVGIEEPEAALHPGAADVLYEALVEASQDRQILVTSHSPDLLDNPEVSVEQILSVVSRSGTSKIGRLDEADRSTLEDELFTAGELLRDQGLVPDEDETDLEADQMELFREFGDE